MAELHWRGAELSARIREATAAAIDETTAEAADTARGSHWWRNRTGRLEGEIVSQSCEDSTGATGADERAAIGGKLAGRFGVTGPNGRSWVHTDGDETGFYGLFLERKTPFLRPAADATFPHLSERVRRNLANG